MSAEKQRHFETVLFREPFTGLKAILDKLSSDREAQFEAVEHASSYEQLIEKLGYRVTVVKQIHVQDCYARVGAAGGIKAVLPYHDIPTHSSLPTLVHFDSTVTITAKSSAFFNRMLTELRRELGVCVENK